VPRRRPAPGRGPGAGNDSGSAVAEIVIVLPTVILGLALFFQVAMWGLSDHALSAAVAEAGAAARAEYQGPSDATQVARSEISSLAAALVAHPVISVTLQPGGFVEVAAHASVPSIVPGLDPTVSATSIGPLQKFRAGE